MSGRKYPIDRIVKITARPLAAIGFIQSGEEVFGREIGHGVHALVRLSPGFSNAPLPAGTSLVLPSAGLYIERIDRLSHGFRGTPLPRREPYEQIGCPMYMLSADLHQGGEVWREGGDNSEVLEKLCTAVLQKVLPTLAALTSPGELASRLERNDLHPWFCQRADLLPLVLAAEGRYVEAERHAKIFLADIASREPSGSALLRSYAEFVAALRDALIWAPPG
jgi:hypothetical protein